MPRHRHSGLISKVGFFLVLIGVGFLGGFNSGPPQVRAFSWNFGGSDEAVVNDGGKTGGAGHKQRNTFYKNRDLQLEELLSSGSEKCINKPCVQSEQCCPGSVCVDTLEKGKRPVTGTCLPIYGVNEGDNCSDDDDCEPGLRCLSNQPLNLAPPSGHSSASASGSSDSAASALMASMSRSSAAKSCQPPGQEMRKKQYNDECSTSSECDASHGLCCQLIKRHRMTPRRACLYFSDPVICIGPVDVTFARPMAYSSLHYTPNEHEYFRARIG